MPSRHDPVDSLADIVENAERIEQYLTGMDRAGFAGNGLMRDAVERCLERVCEAAHRLGEHAAALMPSQPWATFAGWATGCGMLMIEAAWTLFGMLLALMCPAWQ